MFPKERAFIETSGWNLICYMHVFTQRNIITLKITNSRHSWPKYHCTLRTQWTCAMLGCAATSLVLCCTNNLDPVIIPLVCSCCYLCTERRSHERGVSVFTVETISRVVSLKENHIMLWMTKGGHAVLRTRSARHTACWLDSRSVLQGLGLLPAEGT